MSAKPFENKVILITGAGSGIGRATSIKLSRLGATLALSYINLAPLTETASLCLPTPEIHLTEAFDVASTQGCRIHIENILSTHGRIDHVFNCAGVNPKTIATEEISDEYYRLLMDTNVKGTFNICRSAIPHLSPGSTIVNTSSICGVQPFSGFAVYCASKYAIVGFSKSLALELGKKRVKVNVVAPGYIHTPTNAAVVEGEDKVKELEKSVALGRMGRPEEVADVVAWLIGGESGYVSGSVVEVNGAMK
jgi:NAD(P)-dependent dehydrogenase (short-subunit alcohol dehydrogenase family)